MICPYLIIKPIPYIQRQRQQQGRAGRFLLWALMQSSSGGVGRVVGVHALGLASPSDAPRGAIFRCQHPPLHHLSTA
eukprot:scaffold25018_cov86-Skeletonema_dohrnii-CCMP3373.AAC.2